MKFGGTSVGDAAHIRKVVDIVGQQLDRDPVVVVSAHAGVTDALQEIATAAPHGAADAAPVAERHRRILADLELPTDLLDPLLGEIDDLARGLRLVGSASPKAVDLLLSYGERCSARVVAAALTRAGTRATAVDANRAGLVTDSSFGRARPLPDDGRIGRALDAIAGVPVVTGFIAADSDGNITTLGRNGSDYSAALFGSALGVAEIQVWKDVDGVRTADPRLVPAARPIRNMSFDEVCELASFGSRVLHPAAIVPAMLRGIPVLVRNTGQPDQPGTRIDNASGNTATAVAAIAHRTDMTLVTVTSQRIVTQHAFLARLFEELHAAACNVGPVAVSEGAVTFAIAAPSADDVLPRLTDLGDVRLERELAVVGVVGGAQAMEAGTAATVLSTLAGAGIHVRCTGQGARGGTLAVVVAADALERAVIALHDAFFAAEGAR